MWKRERKGVKMRLSGSYYGRVEGVSVKGAVRGLIVQHVSTVRIIHSVLYMRRLMINANFGPNGDVGMVRGSGGGRTSRDYFRSLFLSLCRKKIG